MNRFVDILNRIRQNVTTDWLTPSQQGAYGVVRDRLRFLDEVNLWGSHGVGKTLLGWIFQKQGLAVYVPCLSRIEEQPSRLAIVIDNVGWQRGEVREALHYCRSWGYRKVVLITTEPVQEQISSVQLFLSKEDREKVIANLRSIGVVPYSDTPRNLWDLVAPVELRC